MKLQVGEDFKIHITYNFPFWNIFTCFSDQHFGFLMPLNKSHKFPLPYIKTNACPNKTFPVNRLYHYYW